MNRRKKVNRKSGRTGFTLVEMAVAMTILAIAAAGGLAAINRSKESDNIRITRERMDTILKMLDRYYLKYGHLPCPANPTVVPTDPTFGRWYGTGVGVCDNLLLHSANTYMGAVPTGPLGLEPDYLLDGWKRMIGYAVDQSMTNTGGTAHIAIQNGAGASVILKPDATPDLAAVAIVSYGKNGWGAYRFKGARILTDPVSGRSAAQRTMENYNAAVDGGTTFVSGDIFRQLDLREAAGGNPAGTTTDQVFDDILAWRTRDQLVNATHH